METKPIIFFDGVCGLCNGFVDFIMKIDRSQKIFFSPLQSEKAQNLLEEKYTKNLSTIVFINNGIIRTKSDAVLEVLKTVGGIWKLSFALKIFPRFFRDFLYEVIASNRYKLFGKKQTCRIPTLEERKRFYL